MNASPEEAPYCLSPERGEAPDPISAKGRSQEKWWARRDLGYASTSGSCIFAENKIKTLYRNSQLWGIEQCKLLDAQARGELIIIHEKRELSLITEL